MPKKSSNRNQHIAYTSTLSVIVISLLFLGNFYVTNLREDYTTQIDSLKDEIQGLENELEEKQDQINTISTDVRETEGKVQDLEDTAGEQGMQLGELSQQVGDLAIESESFSAIIPDVIDSVVSVFTNRGQGSGAIISNDGLVVTNYHVIQGARTIRIMTYDMDLYDVTVVGFSSRNDIALLQITANETFSDFELGNSNNLLTGQKVVALGNPAGLDFTATEGIISSPSRLADDGLRYIQTDATLNPGNSGGPLINSQGELIGIIDFKVAGYEELGFAIPSNRVDDVVEAILEN